MGWRDLLQGVDKQVQIFPWLGGRKIHRRGKTWRIEGDLPREFGWYTFELSGRSARLLEKAERDLSYAEDQVTARGYVVGDRFLPEKARVDPDPTKLIDQTVPIYLVEQGLNRFVPVRGVFVVDDLVYLEELFCEGAEDKVRHAYVIRRDHVSDIKGVTPALELAFLFSTRQRAIVEERRAELERRRQEEERKQEALRSIGTGAGRRAVAAYDFETAAKAALAVTGSTLLDVREGRAKREMVVQYLFENRRLECVVNRETLQVIDAGICLEDHRTGIKGDTFFTLESLPAVVQESMQAHRLVVWRHVDGDVDDRDDEWED